MSQTISGPIRWGILGTGNIAHQFATGLQSVPDAELAAVGSRSQASADKFGDEFKAATRHASYEDLAANPNVDVVYVSTPHPFHRENALLCLQHGKAVLVEKPFAINAHEAEEVVTIARQKGLFVMEAMWSRFFPLMVKVRELLAANAIGEPRLLQADFGFRAGVNPESRLFNPALGGGALLDVGVYPISLAFMIFGTPSSITGLAHLGETGVDEDAGILFQYAKGELAVLSTAIRTNTPQDATLIGTDGQIKIHSPWWKPSAMTVTANGKSEEISLPFDGNGMNYEAQEVGNCLRAGKTESATMPLDETLSIMRSMDALRAQWGLKYPME